MATEIPASEGPPRGSEEGKAGQQKGRTGANRAGMVECSYVGQAAAAAIDSALMGPSYGFRNEQLMELAGLSVASSILAKYPPPGQEQKSQRQGQEGQGQGQADRVLVICGPGNNGGDGLVTARHLFHLGYTEISIVYPKYFDKPKDPYFAALMTQCKALGIEVSPKMPSSIGTSFYLVVDAMFGYSFKGSAPRAPFDSVIEAVNECKATLVAVDIPSGWHVEDGDVSGKGVRQPDMLVSLTVPKRCAYKFTGKYHMLGGRFVPPKLAKELGLKVPGYSGASQCREI